MGARTFRTSALALLAALGLAIGLTMGTSGPASAGPSLVPEYDPGMVLSRKVITPETFGARLSLSIREDARLASPQRRQAIIEALDLRTALGRTVTDVAIDPQSGGFVGIDAGSIEVTGHLPEGRIIVSARDPGGAFTRPGAERLAWAGADGKRVCFDVESIEAAPPQMAFTLLIDRSGSMAGVIGEVLETARGFLALLPARAQCTVASFAEARTLHTPPGGQDCGAVRLPSALTPGGATDIYGPLREAYARHADPSRAGWQGAVILITDGIITHDVARATALKAELMAMKGAAKTFVFWLGDHQAASLTDLADYFIARRGDVGTALAQVLGSIGEAYAAQIVLRPRACTP